MCISSIELNALPRACTALQYRIPPSKQFILTTCYSQIKCLFEVYYKSCGKDPINIILIADVENVFGVSSFRSNPRDCAFTFILLSMASLK